MASFDQSRMIWLAVAVMVAVGVQWRPADATGFPPMGGGCCCGCGAPTTPPPPPPPPPPPSNCCCCGGRKKRQLLTGLLEFENWATATERRLYCCGMSGRKRRHTAQPVSRRIEFWGGGSQLSSLMFH